MPCAWMASGVVVSCAVQRVAQSQRALPAKPAPSWSTSAIVSSPSVVRIARTPVAALSPMSYTCSMKRWLWLLVPEFLRRKYFAHGFTPEWLTFTVTPESRRGIERIDAVEWDEEGFTVHWAREN